MKKNFKLLISALLTGLVLCFNFSSCGDDDDNDGQKEIVLESIKFSVDSKQAAIGDVFQLTLEGTPSNAKIQGVKYTSDDETIASVDDEGYVTCKDAGEAIIKATIKGLASAKCKVTVKAKGEGGNKEEDNGDTEETNAPKITIGYIYKYHTENIFAPIENLECYAGEFTISLVIDSADYYKDATLKWTSSDPSVMTVSESGSAKAIAAGKVNISVSVISKESNKEINTASCSFTVYKRSKEEGFAYNDFLMYIEDVFTITGRGTVLSGKISKSALKTGEKVRVYTFDGKYVDGVVTGIEMFKKLLDEALAGDNVGILIDGVSKEEVERGNAVVSPNTIYKTSKNFTADIQFLSKEEGGKQTPISAGYKPQLYFGTTDVTCALGNTETIMPGDKVENISIETIHPILVYEGASFVIREGGKTIGNGTFKSIK